MENVMSIEFECKEESKKSELISMVAASHDERAITLLYEIFIRVSSGTAASK